MVVVGEDLKVEVVVVDVGICVVIFVGDGVAD